ncbi:hypothetical protein G9P44_006137 [Scheffersomyces stipitis]|nr:hypothetical protein G9P44_006137 [Scheffersomyces stipitis]
MESAFFYSDVGDQDFSERSLLFSDNASDTKDRLAPRSSKQYKIGPPMTKTVIIRQTYLSSNGELINPLIWARIDRGFDFKNGEWIGYKRNYFTLVSSFEFPQKELSILENDSVYLLDPEGTQVPVHFFALRLISTCIEDNFEAPLAQHTAKRDRGPSYPPRITPVIPARIPSHLVMKENANIRNLSKLKLFNRYFYLDPQHRKKVKPKSMLNTYPEMEVSRAVNYDRVQYAASFQYRKSPPGKRHYVLRVELLAYPKDMSPITVAYTETPPLIVRGRSPSSYPKPTIQSSPIKPTDMKSTNPGEQLPKSKEKFMVVLNIPKLPKSNNNSLLDLVQKREKELAALEKKMMRINDSSNDFPKCKKKPAAKSQIKKKQEFQQRFKIAKIKRKSVWKSEMEPVLPTVEHPLEAKADFITCPSTAQSVSSTRSTYSKVPSLELDETITTNCTLSTSYKLEKIKELQVICGRKTLSGMNRIARDGNSNPYFAGRLTDSFQLPKEQMEYIRNWSRDSMSATSYIDPKALIDTNRNFRF